MVSNLQLCFLSCSCFFLTHCCTHQPLYGSSGMLTPRHLKLPMLPAPRLFMVHGECVLPPPIIQNDLLGHGDDQEEVVVMIQGLLSSPCGSLVAAGDQPDPFAAITVTWRQQCYVFHVKLIQLSQHLPVCVENVKSANTSGFISTSCSGLM